MYVWQARDSTQCGPSYSTANQVAYCAVEEPQTWPALLQLPEDQYAGTAVQINGSNGLNISTAPLLYTGSNRAIADDLMTALFARGASLGKALSNMRP